MTNSAVLLDSAIGVAVVAAARSVWSPCGLSMLSTITPVSERSRRHRYGATATWFVAGALVGGATLGAGAAALAAVLALVHLSPAARVAIAVVGALVAIAADVRLLGFHLPLRPRQVDETWLGKYRPWVYGAGFGWQIGTGFATYVMTAAVYLTVLLAALTASPLAAFGVCVLFGLVRGLAVFLSAWATSPDALRRIHRRLEALEPASRAVALAAEALAGGLAAGVLWGPIAAATVVVVGAVGCLSVLGVPGVVRAPRRPPEAVELSPSRR